ncbi:Qat anti-phage system QueC-like protein QatC [Orenia marismortui]|uniref:Qat anti-phage system QueC-like protein QatC n=1 Tax=Orenia marismortui TaxID=46469 RepID=UPI0003674D3D|nr:Qat anti-phage system QueC-like protein QatC [Orenia marismortui]
MKWNIVCRVGKNDNYFPENIDKKKTLIIPLMGNESSDKILEYNTYNIFNKLFNDMGCFPENEAIDLLNASFAVYTADKLILRKLSYDNWTRHLSVSLPVINIELWKNAKETLEEMLSFLSGDKWEFNFRERRKTDIEKVNKCLFEETVNNVSLFSGGLDSFIGVSDLLEKNQGKIALVSHYGTGGDASIAQKQVLNALETEYSKDRIVPFGFYVQPIKLNSKDKSEDSTRSRSFLFLAHGIAVANAFNKNTSLYIPENGLISLNIPLTYSRRGSLSTRTTHPYYLLKLEELLGKLNLTNSIINPYSFYTKGQMIINAQNQDLIKKSIHDTMSCSHPSAGRFKKNSPHEHCGYCVPCIIRRASMYRAGLDDYKKYRIDVLTNPPSESKKSGRDYRAFLMAIERRKIDSNLNFFNILRSGPIMKDHQKYINVYENGMEEVENFLRSNNSE